MKKIILFTLLGLFLSSALYAQPAEMASYPGSIRSISEQVFYKLKKESIGKCTIENFVKNDGETDDVSSFLKNEIMNKLVDMGGDIHFIDSSRKSLTGASVQNKNDSQSISNDKTDVRSRNHVLLKSCFMGGAISSCGE